MDSMPIVVNDADVLLSLNTGIEGVMSTVATKQDKEEVCWRCWIYSQTSHSSCSKETIVVMNKHSMMVVTKQG